jgi:hypothetical protein
LENEVIGGVTRFEFATLPNFLDKPTDGKVTDPPAPRQALKVRQMVALKGKHS